MAITKNWLEELVAEFISIKGYSTETNVPLSSMKKGGRNEADVLGFRIHENGLIIVHAECEIAPASEYEKMKHKIFEKFNIENSTDIKSLAQERYEKLRVKDLINIFVMVWTPKKKWDDLRKEMEEKGITIINYEELIYYALKAVDEFKEKRENKEFSKRVGMVKYKFPLIPEGLWLLKLIQSQSDVEVLDLENHLRDISISAMEKL